MLKSWWADLKRVPYVDTTWFAVWAFIYIGFLILDITMPTGFWGSSLLKYAGIFLCTIYAMQKYDRDHKLVLALFFTFLADTILVWTEYEIAGVFVFCFAQALHFTMEDLEFARHRNGQQRIQNMPAARDEVMLNLDVRQLGLGGASCGPKPMDKYIFPIEKTTWTVTLEPVGKKKFLGLF